MPDRLTNWCGDVRYSRETWSILALYEKAPRNLGYLRNGLYSRGEEEGHHVTCSINVRREDREVKRVSEFSSRVVTRSVKTPSHFEVMHVPPAAGHELPYTLD